MDRAQAEEDATTRFGLILAFLLGPLIVGSNAAAFSLLTGNSLHLDEEWGILVIQAILVCIPFFAVALTSTAKRAPWLVALGLTLALWGYFLLEAVSYQWHPDGSGANIGLGLIMLVSPIFITAASIGTYVLQRGRPGDEDKGLIAIVAAGGLFLLLVGFLVFSD